MKMQDSVNYNTQKGLSSARSRILDELENKNKKVSGSEKHHGQVIRGAENSQFIASDKPNDINYKSLENVTFCDYLKTSVSNLNKFNKLMRELDGENGLFAVANIRLLKKDKGGNGYDTGFELRMVNKDTGEEVNAGFVYTSDAGKMTGGYIELKGEPCRKYQESHPEAWNKLIDLLESNEWGLSSCDLALDLHGDYALDNNISVPRLARRAYLGGLLMSDKLKDNGITTQKIDQAGDGWSDFTFGEMTIEKYDPLIDCMGGLTAYIGSKKNSPDYFKIYEKGKERLGKGVEIEGNDRAWVRIEHTLSKKTTKKVSWNALREPDKHFCRDRSAAREIMQDYRKHKLLIESESVLSVSQAKTKCLLLSHKKHFARMQAGGFISHQRKSGISDKKILDDLQKDGSYRVIDDTPNKDTDYNIVMDLQSRKVISQHDSLAV